MSEATLKMKRGGKTPTQYILDMKEAIKPTEGDLRFAVEGQRTRILDRTARGVDVNEQPFAPYSTKGPYYYYPNGRAGGPNSTAARQKNYEAAARLHAKLNKGNRGTPIGQVTPGGAIKFESYAQFKLTGLGRSTVDLLGPRAPHMLQALMVVVRSASEVILGIYGDEGKRASGHNTGTKTLPKREFMGANDDDRGKMSLDIKARILARLKGIQS